MRARIFLTALLVLLGWGPVRAADDDFGPTWAELRELERRLEEVETRNDLVERQLTSDDPTVLQCNSTEPPCDDRGWVERLSGGCVEPPVWRHGDVVVRPFGYLAADVIASEKAFALLGGPLFLLPAVPSDVPDSRFSITAQQTTLGFNISGPDLADYSSSGVVAFNFFGDRPIQNNPGVFFVLGYGQLQNDDWRFWAGQDGDGIGRQNTNSPAWTTHKQSGNFGQVRPGFRVERFVDHADLARSTLYLGLTQQVVLDFIANPEVAGTDNGWPNVEVRWQLDLGEECGGGRPVTFALGGLVGETRAVDLAGGALPNVSTSWAVVPELRLQVGRWGFQGEAFAGEAMGTYNAGIGQSLNLITDEPVYSVGAFGEVFCDVTPDFTVAVGCGVDDPRDSDLAPNQRSRNQTYWTNAVWRLSDHWETRFEVARMKTSYVAPSVSSRAMQYLASVRFNF